MGVGWAGTEGVLVVCNQGAYLGFWMPAWLLVDQELFSIVVDIFIFHLVWKINNGRAFYFFL